MKVRNSTETGMDDVDEAVLAGVAGRIRELRRQRGLSQIELARRMGIRPGPMNYLEQGHHLPSAPVLLRLCRILEVSLDELLAGGADYVTPKVSPSGDPLRHRAMLLEDVSGREAMAEGTLKGLNEVVEAFLALEDLCGVPRHADIPLKLAPPATESGLGQLAERVRALLGINNAVIFDYLELLENAGLRIVFMPLPAGVQSVSCYDATSQNAFLFVATAMSVERQLFSLAYELGRLYLYTAGVTQVKSARRGVLDIKHAASKFAALFLMPAEAVHGTVRQLGVGPESWTYELLLRIKHRFGVSAETFLYRLDELDLIAPHRVTAFKAQILEHYAEHGHAEPDGTRRTLTPNGRLGDLLHVAAQKPDHAEEVAKLRKTLSGQKVKMP